MSDELERAGVTLRSARRKATEAYEAARKVALAALDAGETEAAVARKLGVDRMTVRKWGGKR